MFSYIFGGNGRTTMISMAGHKSTSSRVLYILHPSTYRAHSWIDYSFISLSYSVYGVCSVFCRFDAASLGSVEELCRRDGECILVKGINVHTLASTILEEVTVCPVKGPPVLFRFCWQPALYGHFSLDYCWSQGDEMGHFSLSVIKRTLESGNVVPGGGTIETALAIYIENFVTL